MAVKKFAMYVVREDEKERGKSYWNRCGVAFQNQDGSFNIKLDVWPGTNLQLREVIERDDDQSNRDDRGRDDRGSRDDRGRDNRGNDNRNGDRGRGGR